jgi:predicted transcriptional regulator
VPAPSLAMTAPETPAELRARLDTLAVAACRPPRTHPPTEEEQRAWEEFATAVLDAWPAIDALLARDEVDEMARENVERIVLMAEAADRLEHLDAVLAEIVREADHYLDPVTRHQFAPSVADAVSSPRSASKPVGRRGGPWRRPGPRWPARRPSSWS